MTPAPGPGLTPSRNRPSQSAARTPSGPCALALAILLSTREASSRRLGSSHHQGASIRLSSAGPALSSELGAGRDPLWPVLGIFSIAGWNREVRSKAASFLGLICSDCVPTGARTWAFHRRCFRRAGLRSGSPGACGARETERQGPEDGPQAVRAPLGLLPRGGASDLGRGCLPSFGGGEDLGPRILAFSPLELLWPVPRAHPPTEVGCRERRRWNPLAWDLAPDLARERVAPARTHQPVPAKHLASRQFHQKLFSLFPTPLLTLETSFAPRETGWKGWPALALNPVFSPSPPPPLRKLISTVCPTSRHPIKETWVAGPRPAGPGHRLQNRPASLPLRPGRLRAPGGGGRSHRLHDAPPWSERLRAAGAAGGRRPRGKCPSSARVNYSERMKEKKKKKSRGGGDPGLAGGSRGGLVQ